MNSRLLLAALLRVLAAPFLASQDRILYGTDGGFRERASADAAYASNRERWISDWKYFCTDESQTVPELDEPVRGLALPRGVIDKLYHSNARKLFPNSWKD
jgi:predicted TIM-barrel fold metal-dependent hydrolase